MKKILITGASDGIGLETAKVLAKQGYTVTLLARNPEKLNTAKDQLDGSGHDTIAADLTVAEELQRVKAAIAQNNYDVLVNNAGYGMYGRFEELSLEKQLNMMQLNMMQLNMSALTELCHTYLSNAEKGNAVINVASFLGVSSYPGSAVYAATKAYVIQLSNALWREFKKRGVFVNALCPGPVKTRFHDVSGGFEKDLPKALFQTPQLVAKKIAQTIRRRHKPRVVVGFPIKMMLGSFRLIPNKWGVNILARFAPVKL